MNLYKCIIIIFFKCILYIDKIMYYIYILKLKMQIFIELKKNQLISIKNSNIYLKL